MNRLLLGIAMCTLLGCTPPESSEAGRTETSRTEKGALTSIAEDAKEARNAAKDAVSAAEAAARKAEERSKVQTD